MPGLNQTGAPNTRDYTLGRGIVRLAQLTAAGLPDSDGFRDLGNAPEFNITLTVEDLRHQSSRTQLKFTDKRVTISQEVGISFILDEINFQNLSDFFAGSTEVYANPHDTLVNDQVISTAVHLGSWYQLYGAGGARVYNLDATGLVYTIEKDDVVDVLLVEGTDYEIDEVMGLVRFLTTAVNIAEGDQAQLTISTAAAGGNIQDLDQVNALQRAAVEGALLFIQENASDGGQKVEYLFHKVSLSPDGDLPLIGDEWEQMSFTGVAEVNSGVSDPSKVLTIRTYDQAS